MSSVKKIFHKIALIQAIINARMYKLGVAIFGNIEWVWQKYKLPKTRNLNVSYNFALKNPFYSSQSASYYLIDFLMCISKDLHEKRNIALVRLGDSEMLFLDGKMVGNIVNRSFLHSDIGKYDLELFYSSLEKFDYISILQVKSLRKLLPKRIEHTDNSWHCESIYDAVSTRLLFYMLKGYKVGLIGAHEKLCIIKELFQYEEYKNYIGIDSITEFISIPQKGASQDPEKTIRLIESQITAEADIYLVGMSVVKILALPYLRNKYKKSFIDIGVGIDALAGIIPNTKTNFGNWVNYRLKSYDYSSVNFFKYQSGVKKKIENIRYLPYA